jgi:hypothetical protein
LLHSGGSLGGVYQDYIMREIMQASMHVKVREFQSPCAVVSTAEQCKVLHKHARCTEKSDATDDINVNDGDCVDGELMQVCQGCFVDNNVYHADLRVMRSVVL